MASADDYRSWSFADRSFVFALLVSVLWHLFWFFTVTITVAVPKRPPKSQPVIVSLGPVLNDTIFRTLVESRPEISKAFYRPPADFSSAAEAPPQSAERYSPGDVVSVPLGKKFMSTMKERVAGDKAFPEAGLPTLVSAEEGEYFEFFDVPDTLRLISRPPAPLEFFADARPVEIEFSIDAYGRVESPQIAASSGDPASDLAWQQHLEQWIFAEESGAGTGARLRVRFHAPGKRDG